MPDRLFLFMQFEFPWELGPPDGRYLMRAHEDADPERVVVLNTLGAQRRTPARGQLLSAATRAERASAPSSPSPSRRPSTVARATLVDPVSVSAERQAKAWLSELDGEREIERRRRCSIACCTFTASPPPTRTSTRSRPSRRW